MLKKYLTVQELMERWGIREPKTVYALVRARRIPVFRPTERGKIRFPLDAIEVYEREHTILPDRRLKDAARPTA